MNETPNNYYECTATLEKVCHVLEIITDAARIAGMDEKNIWKLETSLDEACTNIVSYGYKDRTDGQLWINWKKAKNQFIITIEDTGLAFDQSEPTEPDLECDISKREIGGLGRFIMAQFLDGMKYERNGDKNCLTLIKNLDAVQESVKQAAVS